MPLIVRIDVDRPFGKQNLSRRVLSRVSSELYFPPIERLKYLDDLKVILRLLNENKIRSYIFFRKCTKPSRSILELIRNGNHSIGLHLENSRSFADFDHELKYLENYSKIKIITFSKHGSGKHKYGLHHYPPYEPQKYIEWGNRTGMKIFFGNDNDPTLVDFNIKKLHIFPSAFWLEPQWRNCKKFNFKWLEKEAIKRDLVLLFHPDNITADNYLFRKLQYIINRIPIKKLNFNEL